MRLILEKLPSPLVTETVIVNNILEEMRILSTGIQSPISSLNLKYLVVHNFKHLQKTVNAIT
jgi:hypothetical protein